jgi:hypothetical protein
MKQCLFSTTSHTYPKVDLATHSVPLDLITRFQRQEDLEADKKEIREGFLIVGEEEGDNLE